MISTHFDDIRSVKVIPVPGAGAIVMLQIGVKDKISFALRTEAQARIIAEAVNAAIDPHSPILDKRPGGA